MQNKLLLSRVSRPQILYYEYTLLSPWEFTVNMYDDKLSVVARRRDRETSLSLSLSLYLCPFVCLPSVSLSRRVLTTVCRTWLRSRRALVGSQITSIYGKLDHKSSATRACPRERQLAQLQQQPVFSARPPVALGIAAAASRFGGIHRSDVVTLRAIALYSSLTGTS